MSLSWKLKDMPEATCSIYTRENFEKVWQESTGGVAYIYHPVGTPLPGNVAGVTPNW